MDLYNCEHKADNSIISGHGSRQKKGSGITAAARAFRATTAIVVFGLPLVAGVATFIGYGAYKAYKRIASGS